MSPYEIVEHTADVGLHVRADSLALLFNDAARGMFEIISGEPPEGWPASHAVQLEAEDVESLIVNWLSELLYLLEVKHFFLTGAEIGSVSGTGLKATVHGIQFAGVASLTEIKAVTQHLLSVDRTLEGLETTVYFDL